MSEPSNVSVQEKSEDDIRVLVRDMIADLAPESGAETTADKLLIEDLGYHSLALLELAFTLEDEFDLEPLDEETARRIVTVADVEDIVIRLLSEQGKA